MGGCGSQDRTYQSTVPPIIIPNIAYATRGSFRKGKGKVREKLYYIESNDRYFPSTLKLTRSNESTDVHFSPTKGKKTLSMSKPHLCELPAHYDQIFESSMKIDADDLRIEKKKEDSGTVTFDDDSTSSGNSAEECPSGRRIETKPNPSYQQSQTYGFPVTYLPPDIVDQVRIFGKMDNPETLAVAEKLLDLITKSPTLESHQKPKIAHMINKSLDPNISNMENNLRITRMQKSNPNIYKWSNSSLFSEESEHIPQCESFKLSGSETGESEIILGLSDDVSVTDETIVSPRGDEKMKDASIDVVEFSKRQVIRSRSKSIMISGYLENLPSLTESLAGNKRASLERFSIKGGSAILPEEKDIDLKSLTSKIDELDIKITKSTQKLTELRESSLKLLMDWCESGDIVQNGKDEDIDQNGKESDNDKIGKNISFVSVEREINHWQDHKNNLLDERNQIIVNLNRMVVDKITSSSLIDYTTKKLVFSSKKRGGSDSERY